MLTVARLPDHFLVLFKNEKNTRIETADIRVHFWEPTQNRPSKIRILVWKHTIWQPCPTSYVSTPPRVFTVYEFNSSIDVACFRKWKIDESRSKISIQYWYLLDGLLQNQIKFIITTSNAAYGAQFQVP
jgi:hypothetical protein